jgi:hypothetical protein
MAEHDRPYTKLEVEHMQVVNKLERMTRGCRAVEAQRNDAWAQAETLRYRIMRAIYYMTARARERHYSSLPSLTGFSLRDGMCVDCEGTGGVFIDWDGYGKDDRWLGDKWTQPEDGPDGWCQTCIGVGHTLSVRDELT